MILPTLLSRGAAGDWVDLLRDGEGRRGAGMDIGGGLMGDEGAEERRGSSDTRKAVFAKYVGKGR